MTHFASGQQQLFGLPGLSSTHSCSGEELKAVKHLCILCSLLCLHDAACMQSANSFASVVCTMIEQQQVSTQLG